jgi:regulator of replication initiation timing
MNNPEAYIDHLEKRMEAYAKENTKLKAELQTIRKRLKEIEWVEKYDTNFVILTFCPACGVDKRHYDFETKTWLDNQHEEGCWLKAEIDKLEDVE